MAAAFHLITGQPLSVLCSAAAFLFLAPLCGFALTER